jgi:SOS response regulatory protein OraA/RecX
LQKTKKFKTAAILQQAIALINPSKLSEKALIDKLRKREVEELYDDNISEKLNKLDESFYTYPDGALIDTLTEAKNISH